MQNCQFRFRIQSTGEPLHCRIVFDDREIFNDPVGSDVVDIMHEFDDEQAREHCLEITLDGKLPSHTKINAQGEITQDVVLRLSDFALDDIELKHLFFDHCVYRHDVNGTDILQDRKFWSDMGCNGTVTFRFSSPAYLWLLENM